MRVLSASRDPPDKVEDGSTARTATLCPLSARCSPNPSMNVDFPAPGGPDIPIRRELFASRRLCCKTDDMRTFASSLCLSSEDSVRVMARASADLLPEISGSYRGWVEKCRQQHVKIRFGSINNLYDSAMPRTAVKRKYL